MKIIRPIGIIVLCLVMFIAFAWAIGAIYYDGNSAALAGFNAIAVLVGFFLVKPWKKKLVAFATWFSLILGYWLCQRPSNEGDWQPDVAQLAYADINGDIVTFHNVRSFNYRTAQDYTPQWKTRTVRLSQITGIDMAVNYWGSPWMAHPIVSFQFADAPPICVSIETRKKKGQTYSAIGGLYRQFTLVYTVAEETDVIRLRTNIRTGEDVYLYRLTITAEQARKRFLEYLHTINRLHDKPRWYNAITTNCTTAIRQQSTVEERMPFDWRLLVNGKGDEMLYERNYILKGGLNFSELKRRCHINAAAQKSVSDESFTQEIRVGLPW